MTRKTAEITNSERRNASCAHKWLFRYGLGLTTPESTRALRVGNLVHEALDALHSGFSGVWNDGEYVEYPPGVDSALTAVDSMWWEMAENARDDGRLDPSTPYAIDRAELDATRDEATALLLRYINRYDCADGVERREAPSKLDEVVMTEETVRTPARTPSGHTSPLTRIAGKIDKVAKIGGRYWLVEHKTTSVNLQSWYYDHRYDPQAPTYAWLLREAHGIEVAGVCYDLILRKVPLSAESLESTKPTKNNPVGRLKKPGQGIPNTTAAEFLKAVYALHGEGFPEPEVADEPGADVVIDPLKRDDLEAPVSAWPDTLPPRERLAALVEANPEAEKVAWYLDAYDELLSRDTGDYYFARHLEPMRTEDIDRAGRELYHAGTQIRRWRTECAEWRDAIVMNTSGYDDGLGERAPVEAVVQALEDLGDRFPRNPAMCRQYNRRCALANVCETGSREAIAELRVRPSLHSELDAEVAEDE